MIIRSIRRPYAVIVTVGLIIVLLGSIQFLSLPTATKIQRVLVDSGHVPIFGLIAVSFLQLWRSRLQPGESFPALRHYLVSGLAVSILAIASEALQLLDAGRVPSLSDLARNVAGGALGLLFCGAYHQRGLPQRVTYLIVVTLVAAGLLLPLIWTLAAFDHKRTNWPTLLGNDYRLDLVYAVAYESDVEILQIPSERASDDPESALHLQLRECWWCGLLLQELPGNWRGLENVCIEVTNPQKVPFELSVHLGNATMFFRSSVFYVSRITVAAGTRSIRCLPFTDNGSDPSAEVVEYGSMAMLSSAGHEVRELFVHRIWLQ